MNTRMRTAGRRAFTMVEMLVAMGLMGVVTMVLYESFFVGMTQSSKGISRLDEVTKATRLAEHIRRILRTSTVVQESVVDGKLTYQINYVETVDVLGVTESQDVQFRRNQKSAKIEYERYPEERDGMKYQISFQKDGNPAITYTFRDVRFRLYGGQSLVMIYLNLAESEPLNVTVSSPYLSRDSNLEPPEQVIQEIYQPGDGPGPLARNGSGNQPAAANVMMSAPQSAAQQSSAPQQARAASAGQTAADMPPRQESMQRSPPAGGSSAKTVSANEPGLLSVQSGAPPPERNRSRPVSTSSSNQRSPPMAIAESREAMDSPPPDEGMAMNKPPVDVAEEMQPAAAAAPPAPMGARPQSVLSPPQSDTGWNESQTIDNSVPLDEGVSVGSAPGAAPAAVMDERLAEDDPFLGQPPADGPRARQQQPPQGAQTERSGDTDSPFQD